MAESRRGLYFLVLLAVNAMWAFQFSGAKLATERLGPITVTALPMLLATALLIPVFVVENRVAKAPKKRIETWALRDFVLLALFGTEAAMPSIAAVGATVAGASFGTVAEAIVQATSEQRNDATGNTKDIIAT